MIDRACRIFTGEDVAPGGEEVLASCCAIDELLDYGLSWCRLESARSLGECHALIAVEDGWAAAPTAGGEEPRTALFQAVTWERKLMDRGDGPLTRRIAMLEHRYRGGDRLLAAPAPDAPGRLSPRTSVGRWDDALSAVLAAEERTLELLRELQEQLNKTIGRTTIAPVGRADVAAERQFRGLQTLSELVAHLTP